MPIREEHVKCSVFSCSWWDTGRKGQSSCMSDVSSLTPVCFTVHVGVHRKPATLLDLFLVLVYLSPVECDQATTQFMCAKQSKCVDIRFRCEPNYDLRCFSSCMYTPGCLYECFCTLHLKIGLSMALIVPVCDHFTSFADTC